MRPKQLNGKNLSGNMFGTLIKSYVEAINNGASPNIESAWNYICKNECQKSMSEGLENYDRIIREILGGKLPVAHDELRVKNYFEYNKFKFSIKKLKIKVPIEFQILNIFFLGISQNRKDDSPNEFQKKGNR